MSPDQQAREVFNLFATKRGEKSFIILDPQGFVLALAGVIETTIADEQEISAKAVAAERREILRLLGHDIETDAVDNLEGALTDLKWQEGDKVIISTIERVQKQVTAVVVRCLESVAK